jgi:chromatin segregation and condensation protein Rec8/ScpA/Scc1 (kleisin family)
LGIGQDDVTVSEMIEYLHSQIPTGEGESVDGVKLLREQSTSSHRACLFLAMLEMAREHILELDQKEVFGPLWLSLR